MNKFNVLDWIEDDGAAEKYAKDYDCIILHNVRGSA